MLAELRKKSQITIPKKIVSKLGLNEGDRLEVSEENGVITIVPVVVYPKKYIDELKQEIEITKAEIKSGRRQTFDNINELLHQLENN